MSASQEDRRSEDVAALMVSNEESVITDFSGSRIGPELFYPESTISEISYVQELNDTSVNIFTGEAIKIINALIKLNYKRDILTKLTPETFQESILQPSSLRVELLTELLKSVCPTEEFWTPWETYLELSPIEKCFWACMHWGISNCRLVVGGKLGAKEDMKFWMRVINTVELLKKDSEKASRILCNDCFVNEKHLEWKDVIEKCFCGALNQDMCVNMSHIYNMEELLINGMLESDHSLRLISDVWENISNSPKTPSYSGGDLCGTGVLGTLRQSLSENEIQLLNADRQSLCRVIGNYVNFMDRNNWFLANKTEFVVFHSTEAYDCFKQIMDLHRSCLRKYDEIVCGLDFGEDL